MKTSKLIHSSIFSWLNLTGKKVDLELQPYLNGPIAGNENIGEEFYSKLAEKNDFQIREADDLGLLSNFQDVINPESQNLENLDQTISRFYEKTSQYNLEVWSKWIAPISWFAKLLIKTVSSEIKQLNIPLDSLETSYGMSSSIIGLVNKNGDVEYTCWLRKSNKSNKVVYAGFYSAIEIEGLNYKYVRVVFPMPNGNVTVLLKVEVHSDGSVELISDSKRYKETGYYRLHMNSKNILKCRKIPIKESIHVFQDSNNVLRTDHYFKWWNMTFLKLHYKINPK